jgi:UDP-N-acetylglucosamine transferase subunit ALG13
MIVVSVGTHEQAFDRLLGAVAELGGSEELLVQYGTSTCAHGRGEWVDYLSFDELAEYVSKARVFVCHAGVGSIVLARRYGLRPIVVPRRHELGEHVDDHQLELSRRLAQSGIVTLVEDERDLAAAVFAAPDDLPAAHNPLRGPDALGAHVRTALEGYDTARLSARAA